MTSLRFADSDMDDAHVPDPGELSVVPAAADPRQFECILQDPAFAEIEANPHTGAFGRAYHPAIHGNQDASFAVCLDGAALLVCPCAPLGGTLGYYGMPLRMFERARLGAATCRAAFARAFSHLDELAVRLAARGGAVCDPDASEASLVRGACRARGGQMEVLPVASVDLEAGHAVWRSALRKSSRSLINWGRRNLVIGFVNGEAPDRALFDRYQAFHAEVAGRTTRPQASWDVMYEWIAGGRGELVAGFLDGRLVAGSLFIDGTRTCLYASAVYDRALFDKPLGHYPIWLEFERAQARGMKTLELGAVPARGTVSEKEYQIGYFKRGFATSVENSVVWRW